MVKREMHVGILFGLRITGGKRFFEYVGSGERIILNWSLKK
jgi:hypothetical protein